MAPWTERFAEVVRDWQNRLLQIDRRNNLLYFRMGRNSVRIEANPDELAEALVSSRLGLSFTYAERRGVRAQQEDTDEEAVQVITGDLKTEVEPLDLQRRLRNLRRKDREWEEEQGLNVLFLAVGFLHWIDEDGEDASSPLLLIPCDLVQASPRDPFYLLRESDDVSANLTLMHQMSKIGIVLPEYGDSAPSEYIHSASNAVRARDDWRVSDEIVLSTFSYSKMAMWQDLEVMRQDGTDSTLIHQLAGDQEDIPFDEVEDPLGGEDDFSGARLDDLLNVKDEYTVLPADFSQLRAITRSRTGRHLVIHGPPGTGKSQTITNIIATLLADGKRVLFVSEKTAALDIVKRWLERQGLGAFCLDLHSERGKKSSVYEQLRRSLKETKERGDREFPFDDLLTRRSRLNDAARALHRVRTPLNQTIYEIQGRFALLQSLPAVELPSVKVEGLDAAGFDAIRQSCARIARRAAEFDQHTTSRWIPLRSRQVELQLADQIRSDMRLLSDAVVETEGSLKRAGKALGFAAPLTCRDGLGVAAVADHLASSPGVPSGWLANDTRQELYSAAEDLRALSTDYLSARRRVVDLLGDKLPGLDFKDLKSRTSVEGEDRERLERVIGDGWKSLQLARFLEINQASDRLVGLLSELSSLSGELSSLCPHLPRGTWGELDAATDLASDAARFAPVPLAWTTVEGREQAAHLIETAREIADRLVRAETELHADFEDEIVQHVDRALLARYQSDYRSFWKRLKGQFRRDQALLQGLRIDRHKTSVDTAAEAIELALEVADLRSRFDGIANAVADVAGRLYESTHTDWDTVALEMSEFGELQLKWPARHRNALNEQLAGEEAREKLDLLLESIQELKSEVGEYLDSIGRNDWRSPAQRLDAISVAVHESLAVLSRVVSAIDTVHSLLRRVPTDVQEMLDLISCAAMVSETDANMDRIDSRFASRLGERYLGLTSTDWEDVLGALGWTDRLRELLPSDVPEEVRSRAERSGPSPESAQLAQAVETAIHTFGSACDQIAKRFDWTATSWGAWEDAPFEELREWVGDLTAHAETASSWLDYVGAVSVLETAVGSAIVSEIHRLGRSAEELPRLVERQIYAAWLDHHYRSEPVLRDLNSEDQSHLRNEFGELDRLLAANSARRVRQKLIAEYPEPNVTMVNAGQLGLLRGELSKRRRQLPVRRLFARIPHILQVLKPVFLMSPLAVSQYLSNEQAEEGSIEFDTVIFDEASQVFPEDAVPAISRGKQVIIVGDEHQLPPSNFFRRSLNDDSADEDDDDQDADAFEGRDSILEVMVGMSGRGVVEEYLRVHYRSRHSTLIRFSNHHYYRDELLLFPDADPVTVWTGLRGEYLPDGRYDAGATRTNPKEANWVCELVFGLMEDIPLDESIGVVTLSRPQADYIYELIDSRRLDRRDLDHRFQEDMQEPFFVKNLENVQGDERDHIILSLGYGPTVGSGAVPNRFGPINREGGERRLNVAVTRARRTFTVVHSLRPQDITSDQKGARLLRRYLEYVTDPEGAFESEVTVDPAAVEDSPFEEAVYRALIEQGYRVDKQVGVLGYRIDLAVLAEDGSRYILGIECDGATYHRAPAARDRDWLRQKVLEGLGWSIHRIWSTAWVRNPEAELASVERAIREARTGPGDRQHASPSVGDSGTLILHELTEDIDRSGLDEEDDGRSDNDSDNAAEPHRTRAFEYYRQANLSAIPITGELQTERHDTLERLILHVLDEEGPVHTELLTERIRSRYGLNRAGRVIRDRMRLAIGQLGDSISRDGDFLDTTLRTSVVPRRPEPGDEPRKIEHISDEELTAGLIDVLRLMYGGSTDELVKESSKQFGYQRLGSDIRRRLEFLVEALIAEGQIQNVSGMLSVARGI